MVAAKAPRPTSDASLVHHMFSVDLPREHGFEPLEIEGTLPRALRGTLYRNGPAKFGQFGQRYSHPFEGDGGVTAFRLEDGKAYGAARVHASAGLREEAAAGKLLYGMAAPWSRRVRNALGGRGKNTANTNVMMWQGRLFALMEAGKPTEVDPTDLATRGETDLGIVRGFFSAHPHRVESRQATYNFGLEYGRVTKLHLYELPDVGIARRIGAVDLGFAPMLHDFIATANYLVFFVSPAAVDVPRMMLQVGGFEKLFRWRPERGTEVICVPIDRPHEVVRFTVDAFYQWHFANAFERDRELVIDYVRYASFDSFYDIGAQLADTRTPVAWGYYHRATIDLAARTLRSEQLSDRACEFPTIAPGREGRAHDVAYVVLGELDGIGAIDRAGRVTAHALPADQRATEPLYVDGYLLALCHTAERAFLAVYDAARIPDGPVARVWLDHHVPITFHGTFAPAAR